MIINLTGPKLSPRQQNATISFYMHSLPFGYHFRKGHIIDKLEIPTHHSASLAPDRSRLHRVLVPASTSLVYCLLRLMDLENASLNPIRPNIDKSVAHTEPLVRICQPHCRDPFFVFLIFG
ncbi:hypothetical protein NXS19_005976 [Fusarium pseudograminearum]|nr:hypothetical protein NXS19_005976 [Fusarium pseudograminearum]